MQLAGHRVTADTLREGVVVQATPSWEIICAKERAPEGEKDPWCTNSFTWKPKTTSRIVNTGTQRKVVVWNLNGMEHRFRSGELLRFLDEESPDIMFGSEVIQPLPILIEKLGPRLRLEISEARGYFSYFFWPESDGTRNKWGVCLLSREEPIRLDFGFDDKEADKEARVIIAEYTEVVYLFSYSPCTKWKSDEKEVRRTRHDTLLRETAASIERTRSKKVLL